MGAFTWSVGGGSTNYSFRLGTTVGGNNIYGSGPTTATSVTVSNLPINGETSYARLYTNYASGGGYADYIYTASTHALISLASGPVFGGGPGINLALAAAQQPTYSFQSVASPGYILAADVSRRRYDIPSSRAPTPGPDCRPGQPSQPQTMGPLKFT